MQKRKTFLTLLLSFVFVLSLSLPFAADGTSALTALGQYFTDAKDQPQNAYETVVFAKTGLLSNSVKAYIPTPDQENPESLAELIFALLATGSAPSNYQDKNYCLILAKLQEENGSFGNSLSVSALAASALVAAEYEGEEFNETAAADYIMSCHQKDGSFHKDGETMKETALCITFLSACRVQTVVTRNAISSAADFIRSNQTDGRFENDDPKTLCYAILALTDAGVVAENEKNGNLVTSLLRFQNEDGSFRAEENGDRVYDRESSILAMAALEATRYGASETKALMTNGTFEVKLDWEGLKPILKILGIIAGLSVIMWVFILTKKKPQTGTLEEFKEEALRDIPVATEEDLDISKPQEKEKTEE